MVMGEAYHTHPVANYLYKKYYYAAARNPDVLAQVDDGEAQINLVKDAIIHTLD